MTQYKFSNESYEQFKNAKMQRLSIFATIVIALITFILKGDLPEEAFLIAAYTILIAVLYNNYSTRRQILYRNISYLTEIRINILLNKKILSFYDDLTELSNGINKKRVRFNKRIRKTLNILFLLLVLVLFEFCLYKGLMALGRYFLLLHILSYVMLFTFLWIQFTQNKQIRANLIEKMNAMTTTNSSENNNPSSYF